MYVSCALMCIHTYVCHDVSMTEFTHTYTHYIHYINQNVRTCQGEVQVVSSGQKGEGQEPGGRRGCKHDR